MIPPFAGQLSFRRWRHEMKILLPQLALMVIYAAAGLCLFLMLLNRYLILMVDSRFKTSTILFAFVLITGGSAAVGWFLPRRPWGFVPVGVLCLIVVGEGRRAHIRRTCAGSKPIDTTPHQVKLKDPFTTTDLVPHHYRINLPDWHRPSFRIAHLADLHVHPSLPTEYYHQVLCAAEQAEPDLAFFTGDFITKLDSVPKLREVLRPVGKLGTFAVLGNHDYWADPDRVRSVVKEKGLTLLTNECLTIPVHGRTVAITGYDYPWGTKDRSIPSPNGDVLHLVLSHTPDNIYSIAKSSADCVFSGHYHAGQIRVPFLGSVVVPSVYGRRFDHGYFIVDNTHLFVASGVGAANPPFRIYCQPDIFIVDISGPSGEKGSDSRYTDRFAL